MTGVAVDAAWRRAEAKGNEEVEDDGEGVFSILDILGVISLMTSLLSCSGKWGVEGGCWSLMSDVIFGDEFD